MTQNDGITMEWW